MEQRDQALRDRDRVIRERDAAAAERDALAARLGEPTRQQGSETTETLAPRYVLRTDYDRVLEYLNTAPAVVQYRQAFFLAHGHVAPGPALPRARTYPPQDISMSYKDKLVGLLPLADGIGAEIGPLNIPLLSKLEAQVLYVDHLDSEGLRKKYPSLHDIVDVDRPMINDSLQETLNSDAPLDYVVASQVFEHVPNPIRWLKEIAAVLRQGGLVALSLPDRRLTFDFLREETRPADIVSAYLENATIPDVRSVYDHHSQAGFINMGWATSESIFPDEIVCGRGSIRPKLASQDHMQATLDAKAGMYLDVHAWVYTPVSFLLVMAQLAADGFLPFRCHQFYPTDPKSVDRGNSGFIVVLEKAETGASHVELSKSYLLPLGEN
jgi:SAM-dependent methyltransferase